MGNAEIALLRNRGTIMKISLIYKGLTLVDDMKKLRVRQQIVYALPSASICFLFAPAATVLHGCVPGCRPIVSRAEGASEGQHRCISKEPAPMQPLQWHRCTLSNALLASARCARMGWGHFSSLPPPKDFLLYFFMAGKLFFQDGLKDLSAAKAMLLFFFRRSLCRSLGLQNLQLFHC